MSKKEFHTERLTLRLTDLSDAVFIYRLMNTENWIKYIGDRQISSPGKAMEYIAEKMISQAELLGFGNYTISCKNSGEKIGTCGLYDRKGLDGVDIGFALLPEYEGVGYAYEASYEIMSMAFNEFKLEKVNGITTKANTSSRKLLEKLHLKEIGIVKLKNDYNEFLLYQISQSEFFSKVK